MNKRTLGKTGFQVTEMGLGTWQVGGKWGAGFDDAQADKTLNTAIDEGMNFIDTADVYEAGMSEKAIGRVVKQRKEDIIVATKCGRQINPHVSAGYQPDVLRKFVEDSLKRLQTDTLDLIQLHCPPTEVYYRPEIFECFDKLKQEGKIRHFGVSVEKVEEGIKAMQYGNMSSVQIIFNVFRQRPNELFFREAKDRNVGVIVRVPLASGLLTGKFTRNTTFEEGDHRNFNRNGEAFDKGETFAGIPYELGLTAVEELKKLFEGEEAHLPQRALQWVLMHDAVSTVIPGASSFEHVPSNLKTFDLPPLTLEQKQAMDRIYEKYVKPEVHQRW